MCIRASPWPEDLAPVRAAIHLLLDFMRRSGAPRRVLAHEGLYQESLESPAPAQLIRITVETDPSLFPEISGHKNLSLIHISEPTRPY